MMNRKLATLWILLLMFTLGGCVTAGGAKSPSEKRQAALAMKNEVLSDLYQLKPSVKSQISRAPGYAVFSNANINLVLASFGGGYGVVKNNKSGKYTYMNMGEVGIGFGLGVKDFRAVFIFHTTESLNRFIEHGWAFGAQADAAAKAKDKGGAVSGEAIIDDVTIHQITEAGLALQATIKGTKFWKDDELN